MKLLFAGITAFLSQLSFIPSFSLLIAMAFVIGLDFLTGCYKSRRKGKELTSDRFRKTIDKAVTYMVGVAISCVLCFVSQKKGGEAVSLIAGFLNDGLICLIIYIEVVSICENMIAVNPQSPLVTYFFAPVHKFLTLQLKRNPLKQKADAMAAEGEAVIADAKQATN